MNHNASVERFRARCEGHGEDRENRIAGAGDVGDLVGPEDRDVAGFPARFDESHALVAPGGQDEAGAEL